MNLNIFACCYSWRAVALAFFFGIVAGGAGMVWLGPQPAAVTEKAVDSVQATAALESRKVIAYVPKEEGERTDVQVDAAKPKVTVRVNGREAEFAALTDEKQKFEKGKLVITEDTQLRLEIKTPPRPRYSLGVGWGTNGAALTVGGRLGGGPAGWWLYGDRRTLAGGLIVPVGR